MYTKVPDDWSNLDKISYMERQVLVYSIMYYNMDQSCVSDKEYDQLCKDLIKLCEEDQEAFLNSQYYYAFYDFDGTTGYDLPYRLNDSDKERITTIAWHLSHREESKKASKEADLKSGRSIQK